MKVFRLTRKQYAEDLSGEGARLYGGRWNSPGVRMLYTASHRSLAVLETLVNLPKELMPRDMVMVTVSIDMGKLNQLTDLPKNWQEMPVSRSTQKRGDRWIAEKKMAVKVPSAVMPEESNILLNPSIKGFDELVQIKDVSSFVFDKRLF